MPLADRIRPQSLDDVVGQPHILAPGKPLYNIIKKGNIPNMIFYGTSGVGKTTVANIIAKQTDMTLYRLNGTQASTADIKDIVSSLGTFAAMNGILLFLDEIQYLNKKQQQTLLEYIESGEITLIASTTENPFFYVYNAILSRSTVFEFKPVTAEQIKPAIRRALSIISKELGTDYKMSEQVAEHIAYGCGGDVRKAINTVELCAVSSETDEIAMETAELLTQRSNNSYDRDGDKHYDLLSALQKSIRGSDENAAIYYTAKLLDSGDLISVCRRLLVIANEDIGLAYPMAAAITKACVDSALQLGMPEARVPLANAVIMLATAPKSNSAYMAINEAMADVAKGIGGEIPRHLQNVHCDGEGDVIKGQHYLYPHDFPDHYVEQQYLPDSIKDRVYYHFGENKLEQQAKAYREAVRDKNNKDKDQ